MTDDYEPISDVEKVRIVSDFISHAPPGEFNEVFNDVRILLNNDNLMKEKAASAFSSYNKEQFTPVKVQGADHQVLITKHGELSDGFFFDPRSKRKFAYDHLRKEASNPEPIEISSVEETWRSAFDDVFKAYVEDHYPHGITTVYATSKDGLINIVACVEDHQFQPHNFWNGRWRSEWTITFNPSGGELTVKGTLKVQVHYYEDGNVQLVSSKDIDQKVKITDEKGTAARLIKSVEEEEGNYQQAIAENYNTMSETTFKALRRQLPITRTKIDWNKITGYQIGKALKK